jgi:hypothetical protein
MHSNEIQDNYIIPNNHLLVHILISEKTTKPINVYLPSWVSGKKISITQQSTQEVIVHCNSDYKFLGGEETFTKFIIKSVNSYNTVYRFIAAHDNWKLISDGGRFQQNFER